MSRTLFRHDNIQITDLVTTGDLSLRGVEFDGCEIHGPALLFLHSAALSDNDYGALGDPDGVLLHTSPWRDHIAGAVNVSDCSFTNCSFHDIAFVGNERLISELRAQIVGAPRVVVA